MAQVVTWDGCHPIVHSHGGPSTVPSARARWLRPYGVRQIGEVHWARGAGDLGHGWRRNVCTSSVYDHLYKMTSWCMETLTVTSPERREVWNHRSLDCLLSGPSSKKHESPHNRPFVRGIHRPPVNSPHKGPGTRLKSFHLMTSSCMSRTRLKSFHLMTSSCTVTMGHQLIFPAQRGK